MDFVTRFAPSPTGYLHLGHAYSALQAYEAAARAGGTFLVRIEDIDQTRCRPEYARAILDDLRWLGLEWPEPVWYQSTRGGAYAAALSRLQERGLVYPCYCTRGEIARNAGAAGFDGPIYPGTCRKLSARAGEAWRRVGRVPAWRLKLDRALECAGPIRWYDEERGWQHWDGEGYGDVVLARRDIGTSYHLAVTVDDAAQGITHIVRGMDLFASTHIHRLLQRLLGLPEPVYRHHRLIADGDGAKLAKRTGSKGLQAFRAAGMGRDEVIALLATRSEVAAP